MKFECGRVARSTFCVFPSMTAPKALAVLFALFILPVSGRTKDKVMVIDYQAYSGPALPPDQVSTLDANVEFTLDGHNLHYDWDTRRTLRADCKPSKKLHPVTQEPYRCRPSHLLIRVLPGSHTIAVTLFAGGGIRYSGPNCTPTSCLFTKDIEVEAGKIYSVYFDGPLGYFSQTPRPMLGVGIRVFEKRLGL